MECSVYYCGELLCVVVLGCRVYLGLHWAEWSGGTVWRCVRRLAGCVILSPQLPLLTPRVTLAPQDCCLV